MCGSALMFMMGSSAVGSIMQGEAAKDAADYNATLDEAQAAQERDAAAAHAEKIRRAAGIARGDATAAFGASGVSASSVGAMQVDRSIAQRSEEDAFQTLLYGDRRGRALESQAALTRAGGKAARTAGYIGAVTALAGGYDRIQTDKWRRSRDQQPAAPVVNRDVYLGEG